MVTSHLDRSLLRLERTLGEIRREEERAEAALANWRERWSGQKVAIARRLEFIESQLDELAGEEIKPPPQFTIVGAAEEPSAANRQRLALPD